MSRLEVLDDVGLTNKKSEVEQWLKLRFRKSNRKCICSVDCLYYLISTKLEIVVYEIHIIHQEQYMILSDLLKLLSILEYFLNLCSQRLKSEENEVREKLDDLSTKKLRTKHTVQTSEQLNLRKTLTNTVHDDLEGLRSMREATHATLNKIITERVNTTDIATSIRFFGQRIQSSFPSDICCLHTGDYQQFIYNNILYTSELALLMQDCSRFLDENDELKQVIEKNNRCKQTQVRVNRKHSSAHQRNKYDDDYKDKEKENNYQLILYFDELNQFKKKKKLQKKISHQLCDKLSTLNMSDEFKKLNDRMSSTIRDMNRYCGTLQDLYHLKTKLGQQLIKFVKYNWK